MVDGALGLVELREEEEASLLHVPRQTDRVQRRWSGDVRCKGLGSLSDGTLRHPPPAHSPAQAPLAGTCLLIATPSRVVPCSLHATVNLEAVTAAPSLPSLGRTEGPRRFARIRLRGRGRHNGEHVSQASYTQPHMDRPDAPQHSTAQHLSTYLAEEVAVVLSTASRGTQRLLRRELLRAGRTEARGTLPCARAAGACSVTGAWRSAIDVVGVLCGSAAWVAWARAMAQQGGGTRLERLLRLLEGAYGRLLRSIRRSREAAAARLA